MKKFAISSNWNRFKEVEKVLIGNTSRIKTEAQLANYIYQKHGEGRYMILAWQKGVEGFWKFWIGFMYSNGFQRDREVNKELLDLKKELNKTKNFQEREEIEQDIDLVRQIAPIDKSTKKIGCRGYLKTSKPAGIVHAYEEY